MIFIVFLFLLFSAAPIPGNSWGFLGIPGNYFPVELSDLGLLRAKTNWFRTKNVSGQSPVTRKYPFSCDCFIGNGFKHTTADVTVPQSKAMNPQHAQNDAAFFVTGTKENIVKKI